jgi:thioredoxin-related protein
MAIYAGTTVPWRSSRGQLAKVVMALYCPMKHFLALALLVPLLAANPARAGDIAWKTSYDASVSEAKSSNKLLLLDFTGSDWCGYCKLLDKEVFTQAEFQDFVKSHFVAVTVDFPHGTSQPDNVKQQNDKLQSQYGIDGFPTLIVVDASGKELGRMTGYQPGSGPKAVIAQLTPFVNKGSTANN